MRFSKRSIRSESYAVDSIGWILDREKANAIGLTAPPSHTTLHPPQADCAIRLIRQVQIQGNESPSDSK